MYSNYGEMSNEMLLFAYGFCLPDNINDSVAVKLVQKTTSESRSSLFYIKSGGMDGIPQELWTTLSAMLDDDGNPPEGDDDAKGASNTENEEIAPIEVGFEECEMLKEFLEKKLQLLVDSQAR